VRAQPSFPVSRLLDALPGAGLRAPDPVRTAADVGTPDPRLVALAGERAAWNERPPDSWEYVMSWQVRSDQQRRLVAGGHRVRVVLHSGDGTPARALRRPGGRS
jgi:hypothetical protein